MTPLSIKIESSGRTCTVACEGDLDRSSAGLFESCLAPGFAGAADRVVFELAGLDIGDGLGIAAAVSLVKHLRGEGRAVFLVAAPQMLAHNLYKNGLLAGPGAVQLHNTRQDEPYG